MRVIVKLDGYPPQFNKNLAWPDPKNISYCGSKILGRVCDPKSRDPKIPDPRKFKFCFSTISDSEVCPKDYIRDEGKILSN